MAIPVTGNLPSLSRANVYGGFASSGMNVQPPGVPAATTAQSRATQPASYGLGSPISWMVLVGLLVIVRVLYEYAE